MSIWKAGSFQGDTDFRESIGHFQKSSEWEISRASKETLKNTKCISLPLEGISTFSTQFFAAQ